MTADYYDFLFTQLQ